MAMKIRRAQRSDAKIIAENNVALALESEHTTLSFEQTLMGILSVIDDECKGFYIVAEEDTIIGQVLVTYEWSDWKNTPMWWIQSLYIDKKWRKKGVMTALIDEVRQQAKAMYVANLKLYVHKDNISALEAYEKRGFSRTPYLIYQIKLT